MRLALGRSAAAEHPEKPGVWLGLSQALSAAGELAEARQCLDDACARFPSFEPLHEERGRLLADLHDVDAALAEAKSWPDSPWAARLALRLHWRAGRLAEAKKYESAVALAFPGDPHLFECRSSRLRGNPPELLRLCDALLDREPGNTNAIYHKAIALASLGRGEEASALLGLDRWLWTGCLPISEGEEGERFLERLHSEIRTNPTLRRDPAGHATREGLRTRTFPAESDTASYQLLDAIEAAIARYADALEGEHPFVRARPERLGLAAWALIFAAEGHQRHHIHPGSWLTGVFYVSAPDLSPRPGRLRIGGLPEWAPVDPPWPVIEIEPEPGTLVLFPSFVPHETVASASTTERISVAFDAGEPAALYY